MWPHKWEKVGHNADGWRSDGFQSRKIRDSNMPPIRWLHRSTAALPGNLRHPRDRRTHRGEWPPLRCRAHLAALLDHTRQHTQPRPTVGSHTAGGARWGEAPTVGPGGVTPHYVGRGGAGNKWREGRARLRSPLPQALRPARAPARSADESGPPFEWSRTVRRPIPSTTPDRSPASAGHRASSCRRRWIQTGIAVRGFRPRT